MPKEFEQNVREIHKGNDGGMREKKIPFRRIPKRDFAIWNCIEINLVLP
ncbi:MAG: hypothetical protein ACEPOZ_21795 [Marinifilaceae bacterium]|jgi:hypothetical protein